MTQYDRSYCYGGIEFFFGNESARGLSMSNRVLNFIRENALFLIVLSAIILAFVLLRTKGDDMASMDEFEARITAGQPVVIEFYSNT